MYYLGPNPLLYFHPLYFTHRLTCGHFEWITGEKGHSAPSMLTLAFGYISNFLNGLTSLPVWPISPNIYHIMSTEFFLTSVLNVLFSHFNLCLLRIVLACFKVIFLDLFCLLHTMCIIWESCQLNIFSAGLQNHQYLHTAFTFMFLINCISLCALHLMCYYPFLHTFECGTQVGLNIAT